MSTHRPELSVPQPRWDAETWPIGGALLNFPGTAADGRDLTACGPAEWSRDLREVRHAGFDHVDLTDSWIRPGDLGEAGAERLRLTAADAGLGISAVSITRRSLLTPDPDRARANLAYVLRTIRTLPQLGASVLCLGLHDPLTAEQRRATWFWHVPGASDVDTDEERDRAAALFAEVGDAAAEVGVEISLELYEDTLLGTADGAVDLIRRIDRANVGICPDIGNLVRLHREIEPWRDMLAKTLPYANYWQVKNYLRDVDLATGAYFTAPAPLPTGYIDYRSALGMALDLGFSGPLCVENYGGDGLAVSAANRDYLRSVLRAKLDARSTTEPDLPRRAAS
jgi:sugar phosphate isomerase/epimerase